MFLVSNHSVKLGLRLYTFKMMNLILHLLKTYEFIFIGKFITTTNREALPLFLPLFALHNRDWSSLSSSPLLPLTLSPPSPTPTPSAISSMIPYSPPTPTSTSLSSSSLPTFTLPHPLPLPFAGFEVVFLTLNAVETKSRNSKPLPYHYL
ncbi:hypothetical protein CR513_15875, partial [Mucuna pruriens]